MQNGRIALVGECSKDLELGPHAFFIYVTSAATTNETLVVVPFRIQ